MHNHDGFREQNEYRFAFGTGRSVFYSDHVDENAARTAIRASANEARVSLSDPRTTRLRYNAARRSRTENDFGTEGSEVRILSPITKSQKH